MNTPLKILLLEDSRDDADLIERELQRAGISFESLIVNKKDEFEHALITFRPNVILSDHSLPQFNSIEALKVYKHHQAISDLHAPFILITGAVSEEFAVQCIKAGVDDYILKDRLKRLPASILNALEKTTIELERQRYLSKVISNEAMMKEAEYLAGFGSWSNDLTTGRIKWSDEMFRIFGYEPGEIDPTYETLLNHVHAEDANSVGKLLATTFKSFVPYEGEFRINDKQGKLKHLFAKITVKRNPDNMPVALNGFSMDITKRKLAETKLEKNRQEYKSLFDQNPDAVFSLDLNGMFRNCNNVLESMCAESRDALLQSNFRRFISEEDQAKTIHHFNLALNGEPQRFEVTMINAIGLERIVDMINVPIVVDGQIVGVHGVAKDITEKVEIQTLLTKIYRLAMIGGWEIHLENGKTAWSAITRELLEVPYDYEPDTNNMFFAGTPEKSKAMISHALDKARTSGETFDIEAEIMTAKGNLRWIRISGDAEFKHGECKRLYGSIQDIHQRKSAEERLKESYNEKNTILESIADAFFAVDNNWTVTYWNKVAETKLRITRQDAIGNNLWNILSDTKDLTLYTQLNEALRNNKVVQKDHYVESFQLWLEVSAYPSHAGLSVYVRDVTQLRKYTKEVETQNAKLRDIAWIQSHEIRAPLARILGLIDIIKEPTTHLNEMQHLLGLIDESASDLDELIRKIVRKTEALEEDAK
jgi:PAS domain S-box-containing protein